MDQELETKLIRQYEAWGVNSPHPIQKEIITQIIGAENQANDGAVFYKKRIIVLPTGYGKTLCFGVPAPLLEGITLIIFPLRALLFDQEERFKKAGLNPLVLVGGRSKQDNNEIIQCLKSGQSKVLLSTPEMLANQAIIKQLKNLVFSHLVIDEAHVVHQWGNGFRESYSQLAHLWNDLTIGQISAFTATADKAIIASLRSLLGESEIYEYSLSPNKKNLFFQVWKNDRNDYLIRFLLSRQDILPRPTLVFLRNRKGCEFFAQGVHFAEQKANVRFYHAGLSHAEKEHVAHWFKYSKTGILVSTNAYGMGVDHPGIRSVLHWGVPDSMVSYVQETGRAGRDGKPAKAVLIYDPVREKINHEFLPFLDTGACRRRSLLEHFGYTSEEPCNSCDLCCHPSKTNIDPLYSKLVSVVAAENRLHKHWDLAQILSQSKAFRIFDQRDLSKIIAEAMAHSLLNVSKHPLTWNRIYTPRQLNLDKTT